jgi:hypothetical protein
MRLRPNEFCPIHKSLSCCGRETLPKPRLVRFGVQRVEDPHHPRGYRELRSAAEMRKLLNRKVRQQAGICAICHEEFTDYNDIVPDHNTWTETPSSLPLCHTVHANAPGRDAHRNKSSSFRSFAVRHEDHAILPIEIFDAHAVEFPLVSHPGIPHQDHDVTKEFTRSLTPVAGRGSR